MPVFHLDQSLVWKPKPVWSLKNHITCPVQQQTVEGHDLHLYLCFGGHCPYLLSRTALLLLHLDWMAFLREFASWTLPYVWFLVVSSVSSWMLSSVLHSDEYYVFWSRYCFPKKDWRQIPHLRESYFSLTAFGSVAVMSYKSSLLNSTFCLKPQSNRIWFILRV